MSSNRFKFIDHGNKLSLREHGRQVYPKLLDKFNNNDKLILDFKNVDLISNSFLDETLWEIARQVGLNEFIRKTTFENVTDFNAISIKSSLNSFIAFEKNKI